MIEKILHLPIKEPWFSMTKVGTKREEYREISRHWLLRFLDLSPCPPDTAKERAAVAKGILFDMKRGIPPAELIGDYLCKLKEFSAVRLVNGYGRHRPSILVACNGITIGRGNPEWGAPIDRDVFIIHHGEIIHDYKRVGSYEEGDGSSEG